MKIRINDVRLAFPQLWKPSAPKGGGEEAFSASFIIPKGHKQIKEIEAARSKLATEKWAAKGAATLKAMIAADKTFLHDGDTKSEYEGFEGNFYISARSKVRPSVFDGQKNELTQADGKPYSGCYVNVVLELWPQDNSFGKRINAQLKGVQFLRDGDAFAGGGTAASEDDFDTIEAPATEEAEDDITA